jgi:hypothetical protein
LYHSNVRINVSEIVASGKCFVAKRVWSIDDLPPAYQKQVIGKIGKVRPHPQLEVPFMQQVLEFLRLCGFLAYHTKDSRKSAPGFPDIIALKGERQLVIETKRVGEEPDSEQERWLGAYADVGAEVYVFTPDDWAEIERVVKGEQ